MAARSVLEQLEISAPDELDLELVAAYHGLLVVKQPLGQQEGVLLRAGDRGLVAIAPSAYASNAWRAVLAHELGHFLLHPDEDQLSLCTGAGDWNRYKVSRAEGEADAFADELLMPSALFGPMCLRARPTLYDVEQLAEQFQTPLVTTAVRFVAHCDQPCAVVRATGRTIDWYRRSEDFVVPLRRGARIHEASYASDLLAGREAESRLEAVDVVGWCDGRLAHRLDEAVLLHEHSVRLSPTSVLTLLWHPFVD